MTNRTVAFTFTIDPVQPEPKITQVTLGLMPLDAATAQKVSTTMTEVIKRLLPTLQANNAAHYTLLMASKQFTVLAEMPTDEKKFSVNIINDAGVDIVLPLSQPTCDKLNIRSLAQRTIVSLPSKPLAGIPTSISASLQQTAMLSSPMPRAQNPTRPVKATPVPAESHGLLYRIFAAIGRFFVGVKNFFFSESDQPQYPPLLPKTHKVRRTQTSQVVGFGTSYQTAPAPIAKPTAGIRPLRNGNNICFINAAFQALMNMPELIPVIITAHREKITKDTARIEEVNALIAADQVEADGFQRQINELTKEYSWYHHLLPDSNYNALMKQRQAPLNRLSQQQKELRNLQASLTASRTLIEASETYRDDSKQAVWLNALRGFDPTFGSYSQEDSHDLLVRIFDPLLDPLRNGLDADGQKNIGTIPANIDPVVRATLSRFVPKIGEEKQLVRVVREADDEATRQIELAALDNHDVSPLPPGGLRKELVASPSIPFAVPAQSTSLQTLVTSQLTMQKPTEQDGTSVYVELGVRGDYEVSQKRIALESVNNPPEFLTLHLKRFTSDLFGNTDKNSTQITFPPDNKLTLIVDGQNINYEIHSVLVHQGQSPRGGHYFSFVRKDGAWVEANDSRVAPLAQLPASVEQDAYVVFLKRVN